VDIYTEAYKWRLSNATGLAATKQPIAALQVRRLVLYPSQNGSTTTRRFYWAADSTSDSAYVVVVE
jgi:hypothetical protein